MQQQRQINKSRNSFILFLSAISFLVFSSSFYAQTKDTRGQANSKPISVCELLKNKKKYKGKEIEIKAFLEIAPETSTFRFDENCSEIGSIAVGTDDSFESVNEKTVIEKF